jgi:hypothetical protein
MIINERIVNNVEGRYRGLHWGTIPVSATMNEENYDKLPSDDVLATKHECYPVKREFRNEWMLHSLRRTRGKMGLLRKSL